MAKIKTLRNCPLFQDLGYRELGVLAHQVKEETAQKSTFLAEEGKPSQGLIVLKSGQVRLVNQQAEKTEVVLKAGDYFGELSLVQGNGGVSRGVAAEVMENCEFLRLDSVNYQLLALEWPDVAAKISDAVLRVIQRKLTDLRGVFSELLDR